MKNGSILINTARGRLVDAEALRSALEEGRPALTGLDVFDPESPRNRGQSLRLQTEVVMIVLTGPAGTSPLKSCANGKRICYRFRGE